MNYLEFYDLLSNFELVEPIDKYLLSLVENEIKDRQDKESLMIFFTVMFSLIDDGNACVSLDEQTLLNKWHKKVNGKEVLFKEANVDNAPQFEAIRQNDTEIKAALNVINNEPLDTLIGDKHFFIKEDGYLYIKKYYDARKSIIVSIKRLFISSSTSLQYVDYLDSTKGHLTDGQKEAVQKGLNNNQIITGGPGTGKTTSILFLLLNLLNQDINEFVYLLAPSGKASSRMKESITNSLSIVDKSKVDPKVLDKVENLQESTIHRLLHIDPSTNMFTRNKHYQFSDNSIFVIDEASMIDICLFASLLEAIPDKARVFILGDYNQLPSVENGAVFADLVDMPYLKNNSFVTSLTEFVRFDKDSEVFKLASEINGNIPLTTKNWQDSATFELLELDANNNKIKPVLYYENSDPKKEREVISSMLLKWGDKYYKDLQSQATDVDENDHQKLAEIYGYVERAKILCAVNEGIRGTKTINNFMRKKFIDNKKPTTIFGYYPGELIMINKNNATLDLYNGDSGLLMTFKGDDTLYFMIEKKSAIAEVGTKKKDQVFAMLIKEASGKERTFTFYPLRMITEEDFDLAYAITIHKSQGSDFNNIFIILPTAEGHPLLTKQIVYTAVTRSKGITYILSNQDRLLEAQNNFEKRDTNIK